jgi:hypothetical protein
MPTPNPDRFFTKQVALDLAAFVNSFLKGFSHFIINRDSKYTDEFREILKENGTDVVQIPPRAPNCTPYAERFVRSIKEECLERMILFGRGPLERELFVSTVVVITESATIKASVTNSSTQNPKVGMAPPASVARNLEGCFDTTIVLRRDLSERLILQTSNSLASFPVFGEQSLLRIGASLAPGIRPGAGINLDPLFAPHAIRNTLSSGLTPFLLVSKHRGEIDLGCAPGGSIRR